MSCPYSLAEESTLDQRYEIYHSLRAEAPVHLDPKTGFYVVTNFADIQTVARDPARFSNKTNMLVGRASTFEDIAQMFRDHGYKQVDTLSSNDPPSHKEFRAIVDKAFRPARVSQMGAYMETIINELIDEFENAGRVEFVSAYAVKLPLTVIADQMGVGRDRFDDFKRWSDAVMDTANVLASAERMRANARNVIELQQFLAEQFRLTREQPRDDIISDIARADIEGGRPLTMEEMVSIALTVLVAGNETTTNALGSAMLRMIETQSEARLREGGNRSFNAFTDEVLRLDAPIQFLYRRTTETVELCGVTIPEGAIVQLVWASGNRDASRFPDPDEIRLDRGPAGLQHMTFGSGIHFCVGNALARAEISATLRIVTERLQNLRVAAEPDAVNRMIHPLAFGPRRLVLEFEKR